MTAAQEIARWTSTLVLDDVPPQVVEDAKLHVLDTLGCGLAAHATGVAGEGRDTMDELGGEPQATVIGLDHPLPAANAAFANAMLCHGLDFDDTHSDSVSHVSTVIAPAALAAGEALGSRGADVLAAIVAGNEVVCRVGMAASGEFHRRGFHPTAICGIFGGVAAVARLGGLDAETTTRALGIAGSFAGGLFAYLADGTPTKPMHPAWAAHGAHLATRLAHHGAVGPASVLEGKFGLYHAFLGAEEGRIDIAGQLADLGSRWETPRIAYKPYPGLPLHARLARRRRRGGRRPHVRAGRDRRGRRHRARGGRLARARARPSRRSPRARSTRASSRCSTRSPRCSCAATSPCPTSPTRRSPTRTCSPSPRRCATRRRSTRPTRRPSRAGRVRLADGTSFEGDFPYQKGGPENPLVGRRGAREVPRERLPRALGRRGGAARGGDPGASRSTTTSLPRSPRSTLREVARV